MLMPSQDIMNCYTKWGLANSHQRYNWVLASKIPETGIFLIDNLSVAMRKLSKVSAQNLKYAILNK